MQLFYSNNIVKNKIILDKDEKKHCINVLRYKVNDVVNVVDGCGNLYDCQLVEYNKHDCKLKINKIHANFKINPMIIFDLAFSDFDSTKYDI